MSVREGGPSGASLPGKQIAEGRLGVLQLKV